MSEVAENTPDPVAEIERLRELGAQKLVQLREEAAARRAELDRLDREEAQTLAAHEAEFASVIAQKQHEAALLQATERLNAAEQAAGKANEAADAAREGLGPDMLALAERFLTWRRLEVDLASAEDARQAAADQLARVNGTAPAPVPTHYQNGQPQYSSNQHQPRAPRAAQFLDWSQAETWLACASLASVPKTDPIACTFRVGPPNYSLF